MDEIQWGRSSDIACTSEKWLIVTLRLDLQMTFWTYSRQSYLRKASRWRTNIQIPPPAEVVRVRVITKSEDDTRALEKAGNLESGDPKPKRSAFWTNISPFAPSSCAGPGEMALEPCSTPYSPL